MPGSIARLIIIITMRPEQRITITGMSVTRAIITKLRTINTPTTTMPPMAGPLSSKAS